ncbi:MAG: thiamine pyrophosphate-dependent enzyme [Halodesulfurarchaeum sp.]
MSKPASPAEVADAHPDDDILRGERIPHIWCPGCGLGTTIKAFAEAVRDTELGLDDHVVVSGIGCTGRAAGYVNTDSYHTTHGRAIPFATGIKVANPDLQVSVISGDGDLFNIGGNHFIHAARRNLDLTVVCVNNFNYGMTGGQFGATTPMDANTATTPYGNFERPFNLPLVAASLGAPYVSRWTSLHPRRLSRAIKGAMDIDGLGFVEVISPCPEGFGKANEFPEGLDQMHYFEEHGVIDPDRDLREVGIDLEGEELVLGDFIEDEEADSYMDVKEEFLRERGLIGGDAE